VGPSTSAFLPGVASHRGRLSAHGTGILRLRAAAFRVFLVSSSLSARGDGRRSGDAPPGGPRLGRAAQTRSIHRSTDRGCFIICQRQPVCVWSSSSTTSSLLHTANSDTDRSTGWCRRDIPNCISLIILYKDDPIRIIVQCPSHSSFSFFVVARSCRRLLASTPVGLVASPAQEVMAAIKVNSRGIRLGSSGEYRAIESQLPPTGPIP
jgi:hypothetical protein